MSNLIDQSAGLTLGITALLVIYSAFILIIAIWGSSLLKSTCTNLTLRFNLRALVVTGAVMCTAFASYGMCKLTCNEYDESGPVGTFLSGREGEIPTWLIGMLFVLSIMNLVFLSNTMSQFNSDSSCKTEKLDTYKQVVIYAMVFTVLILILTLIVLVLRGKNSKLGKKAARAAAIAKRKKELAASNPEQRAREAALLEAENARAAAIEENKREAAKANKEANLLAAEKAAEQEALQARTRLKDARERAGLEPSRKAEEIKAREELAKGRVALNNEIKSRKESMNPWGDDTPVKAQEQPKLKRQIAKVNLEALADAKENADEDGVSDVEDMFKNPALKIPTKPPSLTKTPAHEDKRTRVGIGPNTRNRFEKLKRRIDNPESSEEEKDGIDVLDSNIEDLRQSLSELQEQSTRNRERVKNDLAKSAARQAELKKQLKKIE